MSSKGLMWECDCGNIEYGENPPSDCLQCSAISSFIKVPEELVAEKEEQQILSQSIINSEDEEDSNYELEI